MSTSAELLQAAKYALREKGNKYRAESLAAEIIKSYPHCAEARQAEDLMREILGKDDSAAKSGEQRRRGPKLTPEQEANLQRHLRYQKAERAGDQSPVARQTKAVVLLIPLAAGIAIIVPSLMFYADMKSGYGVNIVQIMVLPFIAIGAAVLFYALKGIFKQM